MSLLPIENNKNASVTYIVAVAFCILGIVGLYPFMQYYVMPDPTSYLTIAKRYLDNAPNAVNAFWSPFSIWLTVIMVKLTQWPLLQSAILVNAFAAILTVISSQYLFNFFNKRNTDRFLFAACSGVLWSIMMYKQTFADIWQYGFLLTALCILLKDQWLNRWYYWLGLGIIGALAYFSKAYSFYFFPLMMLVALAINVWISKTVTIKQVVKIASTIIATQLIVASPWIFAIYKEYGFLTFSTAGKLNMSWWLTGRKILTDDIHALVPPIDQRGVFYFEDAYHIQKEHPRFYHSVSLFLKQIVRVGYNALQWIPIAGMFSPFYFLLWLGVIVGVWTKKIFQLPKSVLIALSVFFIYPLPFWLMTLDGGRYLWLTIPIAMAVGWWSFNTYWAHRFTSSMRNIIMLVFLASFSAHIILDLKSMIHVGKKEYETAQLLKSKGITNSSFYTNHIFMSDFGQDILRTAYFSDNQYFTHEYPDFTAEHLRKDAIKYGVEYYFYFFNDQSDRFQYVDEKGELLPDLLDGMGNGLKVYRLSAE